MSDTPTESDDSSSEESSSDEEEDIKKSRKKKPQLRSKKKSKSKPPPPKRKTALSDDESSGSDDSSDEDVSNSFSAVLQKVYEKTELTDHLHKKFIPPLIKLLKAMLPEPSEQELKTYLKLIITYTVNEYKQLAKNHYVYELDSLKGGSMTQMAADLEKESEELAKEKKKIKDREKELKKKEKHFEEMKDSLVESSSDTHESRMSKEYMELNKKYMYSVPKVQSSIAREKLHIFLNRYHNILPYDATLVQLPSRTYVNASLMTMYGYKYIATQWPLNKKLKIGAVINTIEEFWEMIWVFKCRVIVALQKPEEPKHKYYWPKDEGGEMKLEKYTIIHERTMKTPFFNIIYIRVKAGYKKFIKVSLTVFDQWPDHDVPKEMHPFFALLKSVNAINKGVRINEELPPAVIHCSAGIGRTGVFIAADCIVRNNWNRNMVKDVCAEMRKQRYGMIQTFQQYKYLYKLVDQYFQDD